MSKREWKLFIEDILESIRLVEEYVANMNFEDFKNDRKTIDAVVRNFKIIGEASNNIPDKVKNQYQYVDWRGMVGLRNRIAHVYFGISIAIVWRIIEQELPELKEQMKEILEKGKN